STVLSSTVQRFSSQKLYWAGQSPGPAIYNATISPKPTCNSNDTSIWTLWGPNKDICIRVEYNFYKQLVANNLCK
ncbi:hypothetical protein Bpfe_022250, partial [Biomphalaria pfeifferi]